IVRQEHEAEILSPGKLWRGGVGQAGYAVLIAQQPLDDEGKTEGKQQPVKVIEMVEPSDNQPLDYDPCNADDDRNEDERPPIAETAIGQEHPRNERAEHILSAMGEIDDVEQAEDHCEPQRQDRIERSVDQPEQQLPEKRLGRDT